METNSWLIIYENGWQEIIEAEDFYDIHNKINGDATVAIRLREDIRIEGEDCATD